MITLKADDRSRVKLPDARPGQVFVYEKAGHGQFILTVVRKEETPVGKVKLVKQGGFTVGVTDRTITPEKIKELLSELP
jgi:hypothetical protein